MRRIADRDEAAFTELYDFYQARVYTLARKILQNSTDAEDVVVDVFWQVWRDASRFDSDRGTILSWLMVMTRSRALDRLKKIQRRIAADSEAEDPSSSRVILSPERSALDGEIRAEVRRALDSLGEAQRVAVELAYYRGFSQAEISEELQTPLGTVKSRIRSAMINLRDRLRDLWQHLEGDGAR